MVIEIMFSVVKEKFEPIYDARIFSTNFVKKQVLNRVKDSVNQSSINQEDIKSFVLPIPNISLLNKLAAIISKIEKQKKEMQVRLDKMNDKFISFFSWHLKRSWILTTFILNNSK